MTYLVVFASATILSLVITRASIPLAKRHGLVQYPEPRRVHRIPTPLLGGVGMFIAFAVVVGGLVATGHLDAYPAIGLLVGSCALTIVGLVDDLWDMKPLTKFLFQCAAACVTVVAFNISIPGVTIPGIGTVHLENSIVGYCFTIVWVLGMINTVNFADGIDGLAGGLTFIFALMLFVVAMRIHQLELPLYAAALGGAALGFLRYNFAPSRVFMGDSGAMFLGFVLGLLSVVGSAKLATALLVMGLPIADVAYSIIRRVRSGKHFYVFDKQHLHHRFLTLGLSQRATALLFYALAFLFGGAALIPERGGRIAAIVLLALLSVVIIWFVNRRMGRAPLGADDAEQSPQHTT